MPLENLSTSSRFAHSRKVLAHAPQLQLFEICQELWIEGDQAATVPTFLSVRGSVRSTLCPCVHTTPARTSGRRSCASSRRPHASRLEVTTPCQPALRRLLCSVSSDYRHHRRAFPLPASRRDGFASIRKGPLAIFTRVAQLPTISPGGGDFSVAGAARAWCGRRVRSDWDRRRCRLAARSVAGLR
jgi:hypothetical protein